MSLRAISTSDWHLQAYERYFPDGSALERQMNEVRKPYAYASENGIQHVFVPGDLSNVPRMDERYLIALIAHFVSVDDHIDTHYIIGNHDHLREGRTSVDVLNAMVQNKFFKRLHLYYQPTRKVIDGVPVTFMPFPYTEQPKDKPSLVFSHVETSGALGDNGYPVKGSSKHDIVRVDGDFMVSGHLHTYQTVKSKRAVFNGSLTQRNFGESLPKGWIDFTAKKRSDGRIKFSHEFISGNPEFTFNTVTISDKSQWADLSEDPSRLYRVFVDEGITVPRNLMHDRPNVIYVYSSDKKKKIETLEQHASKSLVDLPKFGPTTYLKPFLKKQGLTRPMLLTARDMVHEALSTLGISSTQ
mgnify:FL=1